MRLKTLAIATVALASSIASAQIGQYYPVGMEEMYDYDGMTKNVTITYPGAAQGIIISTPSLQPESHPYRLNIRSPLDFTPAEEAANDARREEAARLAKRSVAERIHDMAVELLAAADEDDVEDAVDTHGWDLRDYSDLFIGQFWCPTAYDMFDPNNNVPLIPLYSQEQLEQLFGPFPSPGPVVAPCWQWIHVNGGADYIDPNWMPAEWPTASAPDIQVGVLMAGVDGRYIASVIGMRVRLAAVQHQGWVDMDDPTIDSVQMYVNYRERKDIVLTGWAAEMMDIADDIYNNN